MLKFFVTPYLMLVFSIQALAKTIDVYPVSCNDLWAAVGETLGNSANYGIISMDDVEQRASFVVVGSLTHYTQTVQLAGDRKSVV